MKATNLRHGNGTELQSQMEKKLCYICKKPTLGWGWIMRGNAVVCSKSCQLIHERKRYAK